MTKKRILFIDRDGTLIKEPPDDYQVDSMEKLDFYPGVFKGLIPIADKLDFELVMVTNQDGLGTDSFPEDQFRPIQQKMLNTFASEGIRFTAIHIDRSFPEDHSLSRKPGIEMLKGYMNEGYDLENSYVIGDRITDVQLAKNLGARAIFIDSGEKQTDIEKEGLQDVCALITESWWEIFEFLMSTERRAEIKRTTKETDIYVMVDLNGTGKSEINTGLGFFDHMLTQIAKHAGIDLIITVNGDLHVDEHHTIEDTALALGEAIKNALGDKRGIERYGFALPMDDCMAQVLIDFGGRPWLVWETEFKREKVGEMPTEMFMHFFKSFSDTAMANLNIKAEGPNEHHKIEAIFKAFARAIKMAIKRDIFNFELPSTKGVL
ncbi:MAG: bifunctional histidinol-phosphatase/imidazoleglycerol-phosphate dehydratase HisB [Bacteroidetes bacterium]|jgi:imidazoleglycerol-phosphate dehydratase/histidinol-phosphatase|nr:bifunctional histidinol-phosphatase/imidazoleglycerol-phosphate dehydratase HisB [Bacteroidota bacterium]